MYMYKTLQLLVLVLTVLIIKVLALISCRERAGSSHGKPESFQNGKKDLIKVNNFRYKVILRQYCYRKITIERTITKL